MNSQDISIIKALEWGTKSLMAGGIENPRLDAEVILAHCLQVDRIKLYVFQERCLEKHTWTQYQQAIKRRVAKEPVAYITGNKEFYSLRFSVTPAVLIPRPETEILVEEAVHTLRQATYGNAPIRVFEPATGSGVIAVSLAIELPNSTIISSDISADAIEIAKRNALSHHVEKRIHFFIAQGLSALGSHIPLFDCIISNPPYLSQTDWESAQSEIRDYEPPHALLGGKDGLDFYRTLTPHLGRLLTPEGWVMLEIGIGQAKIVSEMLASTAQFSKIELKHDLSGIPRVIKAQKCAT